MTRPFKKLIGVCFTVALLLIGSTGAKAQYCSPTGGSNITDDWLAGVQFADINETSGSSIYTDNTDIFGSVVPGVSYEFIGTIGNSAAWDQYLTVYIDFNQDELFDEVTERFDLGTCNSNDCTISGDILIPGDAVPGTTRMRVIENYSDYTVNACEQHFYSEVEDYTLLIGGDCTPPSFVYDITDNCEAYTYDVQATLNDFGGNSLITIYLNRSDIGDAGFVTYEDFLIGQTVDIITDVPIGVTVIASIEGTDPLCNINRTWNEEGPCPPVNIACETATQLVCGETIEGSTINAAPGGFNFCNGASNSSPALWYKYTAAAYSFFEVIVTSANFNAEVYVYGGDCGDLQCTGYPEGVAYAGQTYYIMVTGWDTETGDFTINLDCFLVTNACTYPTLNTTMVAESGDEIVDCLSLGDTYGVEVSLTGGDEDSYTVFVGDSSKVMYPPETHVFGTFEAGLNTIVRVIVDSNAEFCDLYGLGESEICPLTNYDCAIAQEIACGETLAGATLGATPVPDGLDWCTANPAPLAGAVWYKVTPDANALMAVGITTNDFDTQHLVFSGSCGELVCIGSSDFADIAFQANANETYYIVVTGLDNSEGLFDLSVTCDPILCESPDLTVTAVDDEGVEIEGCSDFGSTHRVEVSLTNGSGNDSYTVSVGDSTLVMVAGDTHIFGSYNVGVNVNVSVVGNTDTDCNVNTSVWVAVCLPVNNSCETATVLNCWETIDGSTIDASIVPPGINFCNGLASPSAPAVWYKYTGDSYGFPYVSITLDNFDSRYFVYAGSCGDLQCIGGSDDDPISWTSYAGQTFYIMVTGSGTAAGDFALNLDCYNTDLCSYPTLNTTMVEENGDEIIDCLPVGDSYRVEVSLTGGIDDSYFVFVGDSSKVMFPPETHVFGTFDAGSNTNVVVMGIEFPDEACNLYGLIESEVCPPENDLCTEAIEAVCGQLYEGSTLGATSDPEQVYCGTPTPSATNGGVWYSFTLYGCSPNLDINLSGSDYDTKLFLYSGVCGELVCEAGNDDGGNGDDSRIQGFFPAGDYYIYISGFGANRGTYAMNISCISLPCGPEVTAIATDAEGIAIEDCVDQTGEYYVLVSVSEGANDFYDITINGDDFGQVAAGGSVVVGPISATAVASVIVTGTVNSCCGSAYTSVTVCPLPEAAFVEGTVDWNASCGDRALTVDFYDPGTDDLAGSYIGVVNADGTFSIPDVAVGTFDVILKVEGYLAVGVEDVEVAVGANALDLGAIMAGDINGDNGINIQDVSFVNAAFGSTIGDANYNPLADTNCNGGVNIQDVSTVNAGFGQSGASAPLL